MSTEPVDPLSVGFDRLHWWKRDPRDWHFAKVFWIAEQHGSPWNEETTRLVYERIGFYYEMEARQERDGLIRWRFGKCFADLDSPEIRILELEANQSGLCIRTPSDRVQPEGKEWSKLFSVNLREPEKKVMAQIKRHLARERKEKGITSRKRQTIPWEGVELIDRNRNGKGEVLLDDEKMQVLRARQAFENRLV